MPVFTPHLAFSVGSHLGYSQAFGCIWLAHFSHPSALQHLLIVLFQAWSIYCLGVVLVLPAAPSVPIAASEAPPPPPVGKSPLISHKDFCLLQSYAWDGPSEEREGGLVTKNINILDCKLTESLRNSSSQNIWKDLEVMVVSVLSMICRSPRSKFHSTPEKKSRSPKRDKDQQIAVK